LGNKGVAVCFNVDGQVGALRAAVCAFCFMLFVVLAAASEPQEVSGPMSAPGADPENSSWLGKKWAATFFAGRLTSSSIDELFPTSDTLDIRKDHFFAVAGSRQVWRGRFAAIELEAGAGNFIEKSQDTFNPQVWSAVYLRYHNFPWSHILRTTIAASVGINYTFEKSKMEEMRSENGETRKLQHFFSPEITIAHPDWNDLELVTRIHHRSPVFGLFGCKGCSSNSIAIGLRKRF
jgi:hypothetical protein